MILIFGKKDDICACKTYDYLHQQGLDVTFIEGSKLLTSVAVNYSIARPNSNNFLVINSYKVQHENISGVLARLQQPLDTDIDPDMNKEDQFYTRYELEAAWKGLLKLLSWRVINSQSTNIVVPTSTERAITKCDFKLPKTFITSNLESASQFYENCNQRTVLSSPSKQINGQLIEGQQGLSYLQKVLTKHPICLQEAPLGLWFQVFTVGDRSFGSSFCVETIAGEIRKTNTQTVELSPILQEKCCKLAQALHLEFAQFYLLQTNDGKNYCFDVKDFPTYEQCDEQLQEDITAALAELLKKGNKRYEVEVLN
jgi:hypothetical protein